ncbi:Integrase catalytic domain-containing protein [Abeliophyllum distichum]|uniref:Integrase catalytic domain-containing protein n=1 Tax=Abeliophyllum distichum TaxID=126358 RepID=A0ABD1QU47_9LAMI
MIYHLYTCLVGTGKSDPITFTLTDAARGHFSHNYALVVRAVVAKNGLEKMLVDDGSSVNIIYGATYDMMGYNQIHMYSPDEEYTSFITDIDLYYYKVMSFDLKNTKATYQRLVNNMFAKKLGTTMEVYVDDVLVKSLIKTDHINHLRETFEVLKKYKIKLNLLICTFDVCSRKFLGFMVNQRGIEANPEKIKALLEMSPP